MSDQEILNTFKLIFKTLDAQAASIQALSEWVKEISDNSKVPNWLK